MNDDVEAMIQLAETRRDNLIYALARTIVPSAEPVARASKSDAAARGMTPASPGNWPASGAAGAPSIVKVLPVPV